MIYLTSNTEYGTTIKLAEFMGIKETIPDPKVIGSSRGLELVGAGDGSTTRFYLDHAYVIASSYTLYYGATENAALAQPLTETTHYTMSKDEGYISLTSTGKTLISTSNIYAAYSFNTLQLTDTQAQDALNRAGAEIEKRTSTKWTDGTATTPSYAQVTNEKQDGKGSYDRDYYTKKYPLPDVSTQLTADTAIGATTLNVDATAGFPATGYLLIGSEKITYSAKATTTFTCTATTAAHSDNDYVKPYVVEISTTESGTEPDWTVLAENTDFDVDLNTGKVHIFVTQYDLTYFALQYPPRGVPNRFRFTYLYGFSSIPEDVKRLCLMIAARDLMHTGVRKKTADGYGEFNAELVDIDERWIEDTIQSYKSLKISNV